MVKGKVLSSGLPLSPSLSASRCAAAILERAVEERGARKLCEEPAAQRGEKRTLHYARFLLLLGRLHLLLDVAFAEIHFSLVWFWRGTEKDGGEKRRW